MEIDKTTEVRLQDLTSNPQGHESLPIYGNAVLNGQMTVEFVSVRR